MLTGLLVPAVAKAEEPPCFGLFYISEWQLAMDAADRAIQDADIPLAKTILGQSYDAMHCVHEVILPRDLGRFARQMSLVEFDLKNRDQAAQWGQLARDAMGEQSWPEDLPRSEAFVEMTEGLGSLQKAGPEGKSFDYPKGGAALVDGRFRDKPLVTVTVPHLVQIVDRKGSPKTTRWFDGAAVPTDLLGELHDEASPPDWYVEPSTMPVRSSEPGSASVSQLADGGTPRCPWKKVKKVEVAGSTVQVNGDRYGVGDSRAQNLFLDVLNACSAHEAAGRFRKWQEARAKNPFDGAKERDAMVRALLEGS